MDGSESPKRSESAACATNEAMKALTRIFSSRQLFTNAYFRCGIEGPTEFDLFYESMRSDLFVVNPATDYKN